jgi:Nbl1 / Borealin N terminal
MAEPSQSISATQKQALIDNLRLEGTSRRLELVLQTKTRPPRLTLRKPVTERARSLRSQYGVMAQSLRSRVDLRINRIPRALRSQIMGDLIEQYSDSLEVQRPKPALPLTESTSSRNYAKPQSQSSKKRTR